MGIQDRLLTLALQAANTLRDYIIANPPDDDVIPHRYRVVLRAEPPEIMSKDTDGFAAAVRGLIHRDVGHMAVVSVRMSIDHSQYPDTLFKVECKARLRRQIPPLILAPALYPPPPPHPPWLSPPHSPPTPHVITTTNTTGAPHMSSQQATPPSTPEDNTPRHLPWTQHGDFVYPEQHGDFVYPDMYMAKMNGGWLVSVHSRQSPVHNRYITRFVLACDPDTQALTPESATQLVAIMNNMKVDDSGDRF